MFLGTLVLAVLGTSFAAARGTTSGIQARTTNTQGERSALNAMTKHLRTARAPGTVGAIAVPFCTARPAEVLFYANTSVTSPPSLFRYSVDSGQNLIEQQQPAPTSSSVAPCSTTTFAIQRVIANNVLTSSDIFSFRKTGGVPLVPTASGLSATDAGLVDTIAISLRIQTPTNPPVPPTTVDTTVRLPNHTQP